MMGLVVVLDMLDMSYDAVHGSNREHFLFVPLESSAAANC